MQWGLCMNAWSVVCRYIVVVMLMACMVPWVQAGTVRAHKALPPPPLLLPTPLPESSPHCGKIEQPVLRAALFGVGEYSSNLGNLRGTKNDVHLLGTALRNLGIDASNIEVFSGKVMLNAFIEKLKSLAKQSQCGDTLILYFGGLPSGRVGSLPLLLFSDAIEYGDIFTSTTPYYRVGGERQRRRVLTPGSLDSAELLVYFDWMRKRGVNVFFVLDSGYGQEMAGKMTNSNEERGVWHPFEPELNETPESGAFFGIYIGDSMETTLPEGDPNSKSYGLLSYALATALLASKEAESFRAISLSTSQNIKRYLDNPKCPECSSVKANQIDLTFEASHPNRSPLAVGLPGNARGEVKLRGREDRRIDIINPAPQRGAARISGETLLIEGKVVAPTRPIAIEANQIAGKINPDGSFSVRVPVKRGENKVALVAWFSDSDFLPKPFTVVSSEGDQVLQEGKRYALIIANQDYKDPAYGKLDTPIADADALAERLEKKFDFKTKAQIGGQTISLMLKNATKGEMERKLSQLRKIITPADSVMVFYAGHGIYEKETGEAYWLPVDAEAGEAQTWLSAGEIQKAIQRMDVRHVLVVADSCFSGGFRKRGGETEDKSAMSRVQYLTNTMTRASREFISSGDIEPVSDGGGRGHSMFARALLDALDKENKPFTAGELFQGHVKAVVGGKSGQSPQYFPMKEGHEGGEFVFLPVAVDGV